MMSGAPVSRREFLALAPRYLWDGIRAVLNRAPAAGIAVLDPARCLAWGGSDCRTCYLRCPLRDEAMTLDDGRPLVMASVCSGCGACVEACRIVNDLGAIRLMSAPVSTEQGGRSSARATIARR